MAPTSNDSVAVNVGSYTSSSGMPSSSKGGSQVSTSDIQRWLDSAGPSVVRLSLVRPNPPSQPNPPAET
ncbi:uncharacterized protein HRG_05045 [Hirsutella rhossiliensis]|uniref:Uncharacterized protein n=1 Tax=Hirsutella rhossiliensis TaxID=111463 RepID=A0A9P8N4Q9_9HYPO|nr:uncharacterized protein HRG_05045 [Hirsutella rhossiliensis]KAH0964617.1 hypothetical protein HRG_05045 [Hirsutella rhossiliensis]